ncbi:hypothetical protein KPL74_08820 [Bacillus sp. NP157]|nr:hypothetical protein KPL74_08820 [Bacillus sp. NP157]
MGKDNSGEKTSRQQQNDDRGNRSMTTDDDGTDTPVQAVSGPTNRPGGRLPPLLAAVSHHPAVRLGRALDGNRIWESARAHGATFNATGATMASLRIPRGTRPALPALDILRRTPLLGGLGLLGPLGEWLGRYPDRMEVALPVMAEEGWYLDANMPAALPTRFAEAVGKGDVTRAETMMVGHFERRLDDVELELCERHPHRAHLLQPAFNAHRRGEDVLAIPVLFAQVDGVCHDRGKAFAFFLQKAKEALSNALKDHALSRLEEVLLMPFGLESPVSLNEKKRAEGFSGLNRHQVLHGESTGYGTHANALRAVSLLAYVSQRLSVLDPEPDG